MDTVSRSDISLTLMRHSRSRNAYEREGERERTMTDVGLNLSRRQEIPIFPDRVLPHPPSYSDIPGIFFRLIGSCVVGTINEIKEAVSNLDRRKKPQQHKGTY